MVAATGVGTVEEATQGEEDALSGVREKAPPDFVVLGSTDDDKPRFRGAFNEIDGSNWLSVENEVEDGKNEVFVLLTERSFFSSSQCRRGGIRDN